MALDIFKRLTAYLFPLVLLTIGLYGAFLVLLEVVTFRTRPKDVLSPGSLTERIFGKLWVRIDQGIAAAELETDVPKLVASAYGTVLEMGPGSGTQLPRYDIGKIDRIYGVEPNVHLHGALRNKIKEHGLSDVYTIVPCGVEDLGKLKGYGIEAGNVDTITSVQVLCSVHKPAEITKELYKLLRPGGQMIVYEHVKSEDYVSHLVQRIYNLVWPTFVGNCNLTRPTGKYLLEAGTWSNVELQMPKEDEAWLVLPRISGKLVKVGAGEK